MTAEAKTGQPKGIDASRANELDQPFDRALINEAFTRLHPSHRQVIHKAYYVRWTTGQIAADLNIAEPVVKCRLHHALRTLQHTLNDLTPRRR
jgi:RNA polymerase sigma-70 factor (ECF subfamily)